jgi:hypothetical protein
MNKYLFFTLVFSHICVYLLALTRVQATKKAKAKPEPEVTDAIIEETVSIPAGLSEAEELLKDPAFLKLYAMHKLAESRGYTWVAVKPKKEVVYEDRNAA